MDAPIDADRRTFLKQAAAGGVVAAAALSGCIRLSTPQRAPGEIEYLGAAFVLGSPVDRGVPIMKVAVDDDGFVVGRPPTEGAHLYCGQEGEDLAADAGGGMDERLRYDVSETTLQTDSPENAWWRARHGQNIRAADFDDLPHLSGASARWRGRADGQGGATLILLKLDPDAIHGAARAEVFANDHGLVAFSDLCTHFCCRNSWHLHETAKAYRAWDTMFCTCHNARFDPLRLERYTFRLEEGP